MRAPRRTEGARRRWECVMPDKPERRPTKAGRGRRWIDGELLSHKEIRARYVVRAVTIPVAAAFRIEPRRRVPDPLRFERMDAEGMATLWGRLRASWTAAARVKNWVADRFVAADVDYPGEGKLAGKSALPHVRQS